MAKKKNDLESIVERVAGLVRELQPLLVPVRQLDGDLQALVKYFESIDRKLDELKLIQERNPAVLEVARRLTSGSPLFDLPAPATISNGSEARTISADDPRLDKSIEDVEWSVRTNNAVKNGYIRTVRDLVQKTDQELLRFKNFGHKSLNEVKEILASMDLSTGMTLTR